MCVTYVVRVNLWSIKLIPTLVSIINAVHLQWAKRNINYSCLQQYSKILLNGDDAALYCRHQLAYNFVR